MKRFEMRLSPNPIFITGLFRSGTTLLMRALSANRLIHVSYQLLTPLFKKAVTKFWQQIGATEARPLGDPLILEKYWDDFCRQLVAGHYTSAELASLRVELRNNYEEDAAEKDKFLCESLDRISGSSFVELLSSAFLVFKEMLQEVPGKTFVGVKEIWCEDFLPTLTEAGVKCIHLIRDPRGIINSRNYSKYLQDSCDGQKYPVLFIARAWRRSVQILERMRGSENFFPVRHEDFLAEPEKTLQGICDFLGAEFSAEMLSFSNYRGGDGRRWRGNVNSSTFDTIDKSGIDIWKDVLPEQDVFLCEFLCGEEMRRLGYELATAHEDKDRFLALREDANAANSWLAGFDHILTDNEKIKELHRKGINLES